MATLITRVSDGAVLPTFLDTVLQPPAETFSIARNAAFFDGPDGETILLNADLSGNSFSIVFFSGDATGAEQQSLLAFFSRKGWYTLTDDELGVTDYEFIVVAIESGFTQITLTARARFNKIPTIARATISSQALPAGDSSAPVFVNFTNSAETAASIRLTLEAASNATWRPTAGSALSSESADPDSDSVGYLSFSTTRVSDTGVPVSWRGKTFVIDSFREVIDGYGLISPLSVRFWRVQPGETVTISLGAIASPIVGDLVAWSLKLEAIAFEED